MMLMPAPTYTANVDNGPVVYTADGVLHAVQWTSVQAGLQYYLPGLDGRAWISTHYAHLWSSNSGDFGAATKVRKASEES